MYQSQTHDPARCTHPSVQPVKFLIAGNRTQIANQCLVCGERIGNWLPHTGINVDSLPWENQELRERTREEQRLRANEERQRRRMASVRDLLLENADWREKYEQYLKSDHWHNLRLVVLRRDGYLCQNCFRHVTETTAHVHHISYDGFKRKGYSFAFECVSLCFFCHTDFHNIQDNSIPF